MPLATKEQVKEYLNIETTDIDDAIDDVIDVVSAEIVQMVGQNILDTAVDIEFNGNGRNEILLVNTPVTEINSLSVRETPLDSWSVISSSEYALKVKDGLVYYIYYESFNSNYEYKANINYGFDSVPDAVNSVAIDMSADRILNSYLGREDRYGRHGISSNATSVNGDTSTTAYTKDKSDYWTRLGGYKAVIYTY